ncbi:vacuolating cytotoxin domain-containing protein [Helicobacter kayseriensis]|uniref:vacuolating cytotoxin domain-containing protein n=1 Tax=Helicobacter kayseriensis TaxID=2905877 RepID=UPI001E2FF32B|nr:vacuolating cytotoxin domain-containing protein [Helicobacter kayseriensis]MCE3048245.1 vacuolating cytotoxin domain-containing protein [Helicobacter kayseriensis]
MKKSRVLWIYLSLASWVVADGANIYSDVYGLKNKTNASNQTFYLQNMRTYSWSSKTFSQAYVNGMLVFGNSSKASGEGKVWFGGEGINGGLVGYITANFSAKEVYLTGTLGAGNSFLTGGGASMRFVSSTQATLQDWKLEFVKSGTQNSHFSLVAQDEIRARGVAIKDESGGSVTFRANSFDFYANSIVSDGQVIFANAQNAKQAMGQIVIDSVSMSGGELNLTELENVHTELKEITMSNTSFQTQAMAGQLTWGSYMHHQNGEVKGSYMLEGEALVLGGLIRPIAQLELKSQSVDATKARIELDGKSLDATKASSVSLGELSLSNQGRANFCNLVLPRLGVISLQKSDLVVSGNFDLNGTIEFFSSETNRTPIVVEGKTKIALEDREKSSPLLKIYNINQLKGVEVGEEYFLLKSNGGIAYSGEKNLLDYVGFYEESGGLRFDNTYSFSYNGLLITKIMSDHALGFKVEVSDAPLNPYDPNRIEHWIYQRGGEELVAKVGALDDDMIELFQKLMISKNSVIWANDVIMGQDTGYLLEVGKRILSLNDQLKSIQRKTNDLELLRFSINTAKSNRLARLSFQNKQGVEESENQINAWGLALASIGSSKLEQGALYGANIGYDSYINNFLLGGYVAYGYGMYQGGLMSGKSHNSGVGLYGRVFVGRNEIDFGANGMMGWRQEEILGDEVITHQLSQSYHYNAKSANVNVDYGYAFMLWKERIALKPKVSVQYAYLVSSQIEGEISNPFYQDLVTYAGEASKHTLATSLGLETRVVAGESSYWWVLLEASQDLYAIGQNNNDISFAGFRAMGGSENLDSKNLSLALSLGGEVRLFDRALVNFSVGSEFGTSQKAKKLAGNVGVEYRF